MRFYFRTGRNCGPLEDVYRELGEKLEQHLRAESVDVEVDVLLPQHRDEDDQGDDSED